jgi:2-polyprenyl-3-methyl-5-hydroxy-6-metoxy-1,4-benzoquinol methylase
MESLKPLSSNIRLTKLGHCPACRTVSAPKPLYVLSRTSVYRCPACNLDYIDPSLDAQSMMAIYLSSETLKEINPACESYYEYDALDPKTLTYRHYVEALNAAAKLAPGKRLLEVGCGRGEFLEFAKKMGWQVTGIDSSEENIKYVRERGLDGICSGFLECDIKGAWDVIVQWDLIEHPQDPPAFIRQSAGMLAKNGILLIATPCYPNLLSILAGWFYRLSGGKIKGPAEKLYFLEHTTYFGPRNLSSMVENNGFQVAACWKTETDLKRYSFSKPLRAALGAAFFIARFFELKNRMTVLARKKSS